MWVQTTCVTISVKGLLQLMICPNGHIEPAVPCVVVTVTLLWVLPDQEKEVDEAFWRWIEAASKSLEPVLVGDFNYPDICWRSYTAKHK